MFVKIDDEKVDPDVRQNVFGAFYAEDGKPYKNYKDIEEDKRDTVIPMVLMQLRWDCSFGFPGGKVEKGEGLLEALIREMEEEINYDVGRFVEGNGVHLIGSFGTVAGDSAQHCYGIPVPYKELKRIRLCAQASDHIDSENVGSVLVPIIDYGDKGGYWTFRNNVFKATALMELDALVAQRGWKV